MSTEDPRISALSATAILTDTQVRLVFAPVREEARVVALGVEVGKMKLAQMAALMQQGTVYIQIKEGFSAERRIALSPPEMAVIYDLLDKFITELPRVDNKAGPTT